MAIEAQVVYFVDVLGRCPTESEAQRLSNIFSAVDLVAGQLIALLPGSQANTLVQNFVGPLLQMIADNADGFPPDTDSISDTQENLAFLARSVVAATPRDRAGNVIGEKLELPANTRFGPSGPTTEIDGTTWRLSFRDGRFIATNNDRTVAVEYQRELKGWELHGEGADLEGLQAIPISQTREQINANIARALSVGPRHPPAQLRTGPAILYDVAFGTADRNAICAKVSGHWVPVRPLRDGVSYEAYDVSKPRKPGYPIRVDSDDSWVFGSPVEILARGRGQPHPVANLLSDRLNRVIPNAWIATHVDRAHLSSPNTYGIMETGEVQSYLPFGDALVPIQPHRFLADVYEIGPPESDKILCSFDRAANKFVLVPEEWTPDRTSLPPASIFESTVDLVRQERIAKSFAIQRSKPTYREGFRTAKLKEYPNIVQVDSTVETMWRGIYCYGLNEDELALAGKYAPAAKALKQAALEAAQRLQQLNIALRNPARATPLFDRLFELIGGEPTVEQRTTIERAFLNRLDASDRVMMGHVRDDCSRIWLVKLVDNDLYGFASSADPLQRVFVNLQPSNAFRETKVGCSRICHGRDPRADDVTTILHEISHLASLTDDVFYLPPPGRTRPLAAKIKQLSDGRITEAEGRYLLNLSETEHAAAPEADLSRAAAEIFRTRPDIRATLILQNADSFAHVVTTLTDTEIRRKRDTGASASHVYALISAAVAHAGQRDAQRPGSFASGDTSMLQAGED